MLVVGEEEVDPTVRPVHVAIAISQDLFATDLRLQLVHDVVESIEIVSACHLMSTDHRARTKNFRAAIESGHHERPRRLELLGRQALR